MALEETVNALEETVRDGKALYIGMQNYDTKQTKEAIAMFKDLHTPFVLKEYSYNMFNRTAETSGLIDALKADGAGLIAYGPLREGLLRDRYLKGSSDTAKIHPTNKATFAKGKEAVVKQLNALNEIAHDRDQTLREMALAWLLRDPVETSVKIGTTRVEHR